MVRPHRELISKPRVIVCEGKGDESFFKHLIKERELPEFFVTCPIEGVEPGGNQGFGDRLRSLRTEGTKKVVGLLVVSDNDDNPTSSFNRVREQIASAGGYGVPDEPLVVAKGHSTDPPIVVMMVPWAGRTGQLETLCLEAMSDRWPDITRCVHELSQCTGAADWESQGKREKMRLRAMLASLCRTDPNISLQFAWSKTPSDMIPLNHSAFDQIANFLWDFDQVVALPNGEESE